MSTDTASKIPKRTPAMESKATEHDRERLIDVLERELAAAREREQVALEREQAYREQIAALTRLLEQLPLARDGQAAARPIIPQHGPRPASAMRQQILSLLERHPRGLHRRQIQEELGEEKNLSDTLVKMKRDSLLVSKGNGFYARVSEPDTKPGS
jgi:hypothetical protein